MAPASSLNHIASHCSADGLANEPGSGAEVSGPIARPVRLIAAATPCGTAGRFLPSPRDATNQIWPGHCHFVSHP